MVGVDQDTENLVYRIRERIGIDPISRYLKSRHSPEPGETVFIPTGPVEGMYYQEPWGDGQSTYRTGSRANQYREQLFSDEFNLVEVNLFKGIFRVKRKPDRSSLIAGGIDNAFAPGKTVLDLGSGRARALLQFSKDYPNTVFIGIDDRYKQEEVVDIKERVIHLMNDDWHFLKTIPDQSVDTILSCKGAFTNGVYKSDSETSFKIINTLNRVAKPEAVLRYNTDRGWSVNYKEGDEWIVNFLRDNGWEVYPSKGPNTVAIKKTNS